MVQRDEGRSDANGCQMISSPKTLSRGQRSTGRALWAALGLSWTRRSIAVVPLAALRRNTPGGIPRDHTPLGHTAE
jgi:hypothetical protein